MVTVFSLNWVGGAHRCSLFCYLLYFTHFINNLLGLCNVMIKPSKRSGFRRSQRWRVWFWKEFRLRALCPAVCLWLPLLLVQGGCGMSCPPPWLLVQNVLVVGLPDCDGGAAPDHLWDWSVSPRPQDWPRGEFCSRVGTRLHAEVIQDENFWVGFLLQKVGWCLFTINTIYFCFFFSKKILSIPSESEVLLECLED